MTPEELTHLLTPYWDATAAGDARAAHERFSELCTSANLQRIPPAIE